MCTCVMVVTGFPKFHDFERTICKMNDQILYPGNVEELSDLVKSSLASNTPLLVKGKGSKEGWGQPDGSGHMVSVSNISGVTMYEPEELVMTAAAGTSIEYIKILLEGKNQQLAFEPPDINRLYGKSMGMGTLGGVLACNLSGPRRIQAGAARDHFLGFEAVSGRGEIFKSGGRVVKNVTGFDLSKLLAGSFGTLAIMTSISIKVLPKPEKTRSILVFGLNVEDAITVMNTSLSSPNEVNAVAHLPENLSEKSKVDYVHDAGEAVTVIRVQGPAPSVEARSIALRNLLSRFGDMEELHSHNSNILWTEIAEVVDLINDPTKLLWRLSVPPKEGANIANSIREFSDADIYFDWGGGLIWVGVLPVGGALSEEIRSLISDIGGHATLMRAPNDIRSITPVFQPQNPGVAALSARIKQNFDPQGILNPGKILLPGL